MIQNLGIANEQKFLVDKRITEKKKKNVDINAVPKINHKPSQTQRTTNIYLFKVKHQKEA